MIRKRKSLSEHFEAALDLAPKIKISQEEAKNVERFLKYFVVPADAEEFSCKLQEWLH
jgi:hypothetical protein